MRQSVCPSVDPSVRPDGRHPRASCLPSDIRRVKVKKLPPPLADMHLTSCLSLAALSSSPYSLIQGPPVSRHVCLAATFLLDPPCHSELPATCSGHQNAKWELFLSCSPGVWRSLVQSSSRAAEHPGRSKEPERLHSHCAGSARGHRDRATNPDQGARTGQFYPAPIQHHPNHPPIANSQFKE